MLASVVKFSFFTFYFSLVTSIPKSSVVSLSLRLYAPAFVAKLIIQLMPNLSVHIPK